jgi:large subunit ribosomal protein L24e
VNCTFCGDAIEVGTGKMYIKRDGTVFHFCTAKCQANQVELGRVNRHVGWTAAAAEAKQIAKHDRAAAAAGKPAKPAKAAKAPKAEAAPKAK